MRIQKFFLSIISTVAFAISLNASVHAQGRILPMGVTGSVAIAPTCPGPQRSDDRDCIAPFPGAFVEVFNVNGFLVGEMFADKNGVFTILLPEPGKYTVHVETGARWPRCQDERIELIRGFVDVVVMCDSGIR
jgi:hypothetical protein